MKKFERKELFDRISEVVASRGTKTKDGWLNYEDDVAILWARSLAAKALEFSAYAKITHSIGEAEVGMSQCKVARMRGRMRGDVDLACWNAGVLCKEPVARAVLEHLRSIMDDSQPLVVSQAYKAVVDAARTEGQGGEAVSTRRKKP